MPQRLKMPEWRTSETRNNPTTAFGRQITLIGRTLQVRWRGGGFAWHRPIAVEVQQGNDVQRLPIRDTTRIAMVGIALTGLLFWLLASLWLQRGFRRSNAL
ncbi:MAG TPA: hypothetical protein VFB60_09955 [Ktedonobacteraceae bacterium]|nr:hypothetical protein [Ktedonobacteraceae bacterium]